MKELQYTAVILKKQPINEADEIITFYTQESGKVRALAKSVKLAKSKMQNWLQLLFAVKVVLSGRSNLKTISYAQVIHTHEFLRSDLQAIKFAQVASEILLKFTPDLEPNVSLYHNLEDYLNFLGEHTHYELGLLKFKLNFLIAIGLDPLFSVELKTNHQLFNLAQTIQALTYPNLHQVAGNTHQTNLQKWLSNFFLQNLEREIQSENFMV
jgi:DNA repair protein RecO